VSVPSAKSSVTALSKLYIRNAEFVEDADSKQYVFHVTDPHALVQAAGYLKYKMASSSQAIFFRGQTRLYPGLVPTLFRGLTNVKTQGNHIHQVKVAIDSIRSTAPILTKIPAIVCEPLLQHYGLRTTWVDLVDNIWVALWFACNRGHIAGPTSEYLHFEKRDVTKENSPYAYILLVSADTDATPTSGVYSGVNTDLIDLRMACPSIFLRPHAQHGLLFRRRADTVSRPLDYATQIQGIIRINLSDAIAWLGTGAILGVHALFPPPYYDRGYGFLLSADFLANQTVGSIWHIGA